MSHKPKLKFWQIWNMSFGFLGIQFGFALQNANVSRIFETLGASIENIPILWIAAPVTGLIIQPIIGHMSDNTWNRLGRRRPYFLVGAILASTALLIMPNSPILWVAAGMLWVMDASINVSMEPFRAFVGDMLPPEQRTTGFAMQSFFIGTGAVIASGLPYILTNWVGVLFSVYNGFAALIAFLLPFLARLTNRRFTHMISLIAGGIGLISIYFISTPQLLILPMLGVGLAWASILSMPYAILTGSLPAQKMGTYMGIFNFFIVIPQIMAASLLGFFAQHVFGGHSIFTLMLGGGSMIIAALMVLFVYDPFESYKQTRKVE